MSGRETELIRAVPRVLWITRAAPSAQPAGAEVYSFGLLDGLAETGASITVVGLCSTDANRTPRGRGLARHDAIAWRLAEAKERGTATSVVSRLPLVAARASPPAIRRLLRATVASRRFDAVVYDNYVAGWALDILEAAPWRPACSVYVAHNDETGLAADIAADFVGDPLRKLVLKLNAAKIRALETRLLRSADLLVSLTERDREQLAPRNPKSASIVLPPGYTGPRRPVRRITPDVPRRIVMLGSVRWIAKQMNVAAFLREADARLAWAGISLDIIGDVPDDFRAEWEPKLTATRFRGFVDDLEGEMAAARLGLVIEATGGGFKLKTLDYVFNRVPVAALTGSTEGLPSGVVATFLTAPDMRCLTDQVIAAVDDLDRLNAAQEAAFAASVGLFDWPENGRRLLSAIERQREAARRALPAPDADLARRPASGLVRAAGGQA